MKRFLLILAFSWVVLAVPLQAQEVPTLTNLEISVWPEFDRPEVLIIYRGVFDAGTDLPIPVEIYVPERVGQPTAVAFVGDDGQRFNQQYTSRVEGEWLVVSFELATLGFQLEYYDTLAVDSTGQRQYAYSYKADYPVTALALEFQVPPTAQDFALDPPADSVTETDGLVYHLVDAGSLAQDEERDWTFAYQKDNEDLTVSAFVQPEALGPSAPPAPESTNDPTVWIFLVAFVALIGVGAGAFWLGRRTQSVEPAPPSSRPHKRRGSGRGVQSQRQPSPSAGGRDALFCHQCGTELRSDSDFCHRCGTAVRRG